jgi:hypothetical protein
MADSPERETEIRARLEAATPGPWEVVDYRRGDSESDTWLGVIQGAFEILDERFQVGHVKYSALPPKVNIANAALIAHAPGDLAFLLELVSSLRTRIHELDAQVKSLRAFKSSVDEALNSGDGSYRP